MHTNKTFFCGEIQNRYDLCARYGLPENFNGGELLAALYANKGAKGFADVRGPFAACFMSGDKTVLVRDPMCVSWLYYWTKDPRVCGTGVKQVLDQGVPRRLSYEGLWACLLCGCMQEPFTMVTDVRSLSPGCVLTVAADGTQKLERFWRPSFELKAWKSRAEAEDAVTEKLEEIITLPLGKDETPCAFLSGGIDSSTIVALLRRKHAGRIRTFCVIHEDPRTDERKWARMVAERNETDHTEFMLTDAMIREGIADALAAYDQPSLDGLNVYFASKFAAGAGCKVVHSGEGGDELFVGYNQLAKPRMAYKWAPLFRWLPKWAGDALSIHGGAEKVRKLAQMFGCRYDPYFLTRRQFSPAWIMRLLARGDAPDLVKLYADQMAAVDTAGIDFGSDVINRSSWMEVRHDNLSMYMRDGFQLGDAVGLAGRYPLMDATLANLLFTIPGTWKCDPQISKPLLVKAAKDGLPGEIIHRPKQGFSLPFDKYCRAGLKDELESFVRSGGTGMFRQSEIAAVWQRYLAGKVSWMRIWHLFVVDDWCRRNQVGM